MFVFQFNMVLQDQYLLKVINLFVLIIFNKQINESNEILRL